jgi:MYXO-CTERM domain-containing protein
LDQGLCRWVLDAPWSRAQNGKVRFGASAKSRCGLLVEDTMTKFRVVSSFGSCVMLCLFASSAMAGEGDPCTSDADCGDGYACNLPPVSGAYGGEPIAVDDPGVPIAIDGGTSEGTGGATTSDPEEQVGTCEQAPTPCTTDADCDEYYVCSMDEGDSATVACDSEGNCSIEVVQSEPPTEGVCRGEPISCTTNSDCPTASVCLEDVCAFDLVSCAENTDCPSGYQCFAEETETCWTEPCANGQVCDVEPVCETSTDDAFCLPVPVACTPESGCDGDTVCYDVPNEDAPGAYADIDFVCWPQGLVGAIEGYVVPAMDGTLMDSSEDSAASDTGRATLVGIETGTAGGAPVAGTGQGDDDDDDATNEADAAGSPKIKSQSSGCAVTPVGGSAPGRSSGLAALALVAGLALSRRRR